MIALITTKFELAPEQWVSRLARLHNAQLPELQLLDSYYDGEQPLSYVHPELLRRLDNGCARWRSTGRSWSWTASMSAWIRPGSGSAASRPPSRELWHVWQANRLDLRSE